MAITQQTILDQSDIANTTSPHQYVSSSFTPVANRLYILCVSASATVLRTFTITSSTGLEFVLVGQTTFNTLLDPTDRIAVYRAMKPSGLSSGTVTIGFSGAVSNGTWCLHEFDGADTTGTDGSGAVINVAINRADASSVLTVSLDAGGPASLQPGSAVFMAASAADDVDIAPSDGSSELTNTAPGGVGTGETQVLYTQWLYPNVGNPTLSAETPFAEDWGAIGFEIVSGGVSSSSVTKISLTTVALQPRRTWQLTAIARNAGGSPLVGKTYSWSSSNPAVAVVDAGGMVTAVSPGTANVTAHCEGAEATCAVTVTTRF